MSKFKVGDKVSLATKPDEEIGEVNCVVEDRYGCHVFVAFNEKKVYETQLAGYNYDEDKLIKIDEYALSDYVIYDMLKPKMDNILHWSNVESIKNDPFPPQILEWIGNDINVRYQQYCNECDIRQAIALAYRSGYLRAKKGRPFKIGGEKD